MCAEGAVPLGKPVNVNTASATILSTSVVGLGQILSERVVAYRETRGPFAALSDLTHVSGIGPKLLQRIAPQLTVSDLSAISFATEATTEVLPPAGLIAAPVEATIGPQGHFEQPLADIEALETGVGLHAADDDWVSDSPTFIAYPASGFEAGGGLPEPPARATAMAMEQVERRTDAQVDESTRPEGGIMSDEQKQNEEERTREVPEAGAIQPLEMAAGAAAAAIPASARTSMMSTSVPTPREEEVPQTEPEAERRQAAEEEGIYADPLAEEAAPVEAIAMPQTQTHVRTYDTPAPAAAPVVVRERSFWQSALLVSLGGLLGVLLTLVVISLWSGTLDFAPRGEVNAISHNVDTMQANAQLAWERIDQLSARAETLDQQIARLAPVVQRMTAVEAELVQAQDDLAATSAALKSVSGDLNTFRGQMTQRVNAAEQDIAAMDASVTTMQKSVDAISDRVQHFNAFFVGLRELLNDVNSLPSTSQGTGAKAPAPAATPAANK